MRSDSNSDLAGMDAAPSSTDATIIASLGVGCLALFIWLVTPPPPVGFYWDDGWYLMMAEWLSGRSEHRDLVWSMLHLRQYPPVYPAVLAAAGASLDRPELGFFINALAGAGAATALMLWMRRSEGFPLVAVAPASLALILSPVALAWLPALFSEHLFVLLTVLALWLAAIARGRRDWVLVGLVVGVAIMTRSAGLALLAAVAIRAGFTRWRMLGWLALGLFPVVLASWWFIHELPTVPRYRSALLEMAQNLQGDDYLSGQFFALARGWKEVWGSTAGGWIALAMVLPGLWVRIRRHRADAWLIPVSLVMLGLWPYPDHMSRFLWPLLPAVLVCAAETARWVTFTPLRFGALAMIPIVVALGLPNGALRTVTRVFEGPDPTLNAFSRMQEWTRTADRTEAAQALRARRQLLLDMNRVRAMTPPNDCVYSELPALVAVQAKRVSLPSPWRRLSELERHQLQCGFYYLMPPGLPETDQSDIDKVAANHTLIFESPGPSDPTGQEELGVFYRLNRD